MTQSSVGHQGKNNQNYSTPILSADAFHQAMHCSQQVMNKLARLDKLFMERSALHNLVAKSTIETRWDRHYFDSAQLYSLIPDEAEKLLDLGSGAGFPGLVLAALGYDKGLQVGLVESTGKKALYLQDAAKGAGLDNVTVFHDRIENIKMRKKPDIITARALAPLSRLCGYVSPFLSPTTKCLFLKGAKVDEELTEAAKAWHIESTRHKSMTSEEAVILEVNSIKPII